MTSNSRSNDQQKVQAIVETLQQRVVDHLKAHGPQPMEDHQDEGMDGLFDGGSVKSSAA